MGHKDRREERKNAREVAEEIRGGDKGDASIRTEGSGQTKGGRTRVQS